MSTGWKVLIVILTVLVVALGITSYVGLSNLNNLHKWVSSDLYPKYLLTHQKVWGGPGDPPAPPPPPPPAWD
jgi:hypothetical protein